MKLQWRKETKRRKVHKEKNKEKKGRETMQDSNRGTLYYEYSWRLDYKVEETIFIHDQQFTFQVSFIATEQEKEIYLKR